MLDLVSVLASLLQLGRIEPICYRIIIYTGYKVSYHLKHLNGFVVFFQMTADYSHKHLFLMCDPGPYQVAELRLVAESLYQQKELIDITQ